MPSEPSAAKLQPQDKWTLLQARPDGVHTFIVRGVTSGLPALTDRIRVLAGQTAMADRIVPLGFIDGVAAPMRVGDAASLAVHPDVTQVWYLHPRLAPLYVHIIMGLSYGVTTADLPAIASMSLGPPPDLMPLSGHDDEPMHAATRRAAEAGFLPVMAIGNYGRDDGSNDGIVNPWARPPWVVAVGASHGDGTTLWSGSARGLDSDRCTWPDLVAEGVDSIGPWAASRPKPPSRHRRDLSIPAFIAGVPEAERNIRTIGSGTSFAVPRVSAAAAHIIHFVQAAGRAARHGQERLFALEIPRARFENAAHAAPRLAGAVTGETAGHVEVTYGLAPPWRLVKQLLIDCALPMPGYTPAQVGAGYLSPELVAEQFGRYGRSRPRIMGIKVSDQGF